jgi:DNA-directed RNA polymerase subunit RPC12/RpoP
MGLAMTIRLKCAECQRKLKVPDEALGKKVQCPVCGARFIGRLDANAAAPAAPPPSEVKQPALAPPPVEQPPASFPSFQLEDTTAFEPIEPVAVNESAAGDETEVMEALPPDEEGVEPIVMEDETEAADVVEEVADEADEEVIEEDAVVEEDEPPAQKKKSQGMLYLLIALGVVLLLACGGLGMVAYFFFSV